MTTRTEREMFAAAARGIVACSPDPVARKLAAEAVPALCEHVERLEGLVDDVRMLLEGLTVDGVYHRPRAERIALLDVQPSNAPERIRQPVAPRQERAGAGIAPPLPHRTGVTAMTLHERSQKIFDDLQANFGGGMSADFAERAVSIIERHLQEMQQEGWISAEERLPEDDWLGLVVVEPTPANTTFYGKPGYQIVREAYRENAAAHWTDGAETAFDNTGWRVTHWRELPTPPERPA